MVKAETRTSNLKVFACELCAWVLHHFRMHRCQSLTFPHLDIPYSYLSYLQLFSRLCDIPSFTCCYLLHTRYTYSIWYIAGVKGYE